MVPHPGLPHRSLGGGGAVSSVVERLVYTERVGGSKPSPPSLRSQRQRERRLSRRSFSEGGPLVLQHQRSELRLGLPSGNENFHIRLRLTKRDGLKTVLYRLHTRSSEE